MLTMDVFLQLHEKRVSKIDNNKILRRKQYAEVTSINMYLIVKIRHDIIIQCHGNYIEVEKL